MKNKTNKIINLAMLVAVFATLSAYSRQSSAMETCVEKIYDDKVTYTRGKFDSVQNENGYFLTHPFKPQKPMRQSILNSNIEPQGLAFEARSKESILNPNMDGRKKVEDTKLWPYSICTQVRMEYGNYTCNGSGVLISSHHVLTAAHNVYDLKKEHNPNNRVWADSGVVYPGLSETRAIFGSAKVARVYIFREWFDNDNDHYDCAILVLDQPIGLHTGWGGLFGLDNEGDIFSRKISITGYPGDKEYNQMWTMEHNIKNVEAEMFSYEIDTEDGQSGSPIWTSLEENPYIMGIHTVGAQPLGNVLVNSGVRLSRYKFNEIVNWVTNTINIKPNIWANVFKQANSIALRAYNVSSYFSSMTMGSGIGLGVTEYWNDQQLKQFSCNPDFSFGGVWDRALARLNGTYDCDQYGMFKLTRGISEAEGSFVGGALTFILFYLYKSQMVESLKKVANSHLYSYGPSPILSEYLKATTAGLIAIYGIYTADSIELMKLVAVYSVYNYITANFG